MSNILLNNIIYNKQNVSDIVFTNNNKTKYTVKYIRKGSKLVLYDTFNKHSYGDISINKFTYDIMSIDGDAVEPSELTYSLSIYDVGYSTNTYNESTIIPNGTITYSGETDGMTLNASTGAVSGTINEGIDRDMNITVTVTGYDDKSNTQDTIVTLLGMREIFCASDGNFNTTNGEFCVLKTIYY